MRTSFVSAVIINYNAGDLLLPCILTSLSQANEIILVDNASNDLSINKCLQKLPHADTLKIIYNKNNLGFAAACNIGYHHAQYDNILFLNPDCQLEPHALNKLLETLHHQKNIGMVGGLLTNIDGTEQQGGRRAIPTPWRAFVRAFGLHYLSNYFPQLCFDFHLHKQSLPKNAIDIEAISGACMLVKREAIESVGLWDENYFLHCEDLDWCLRFTQKKWRIMFEPNAKIIHAKGACSKQRPFFVEWHKHKGMFRFYKKFFYNSYPKPLHLIINLGVALRLMLVFTYLSIQSLFNLFK